jgi:hypothetical protein
MLLVTSGGTLNEAGSVVLSAEKKQLWKTILWIRLKKKLEEFWQRKKQGSETVTWTCYAQNSQLDHFPNSEVPILVCPGILATFGLLVGWCCIMNLSVNLELSGAIFCSARNCSLLESYLRSVVEVWTRSARDWILEVSSEKVQLFT